MWGQVSYVSRAITAEEYNAAVARAPGDCPLFAAGDLRSGRQVCELCCGFAMRVDMWKERNL